MFMTFELNTPTKILFGVGKLNTLADQTLPGRKPLLVISNGKSAKANGYLDRLLAQLEKAGMEAVVYDRIEANPVLETIDAGGAVCQQCGCDFVIALGGGSVIDAAKNIAVLGTNAGSIWDYVPTGSGGKKKIRSTPLPIVAIPTTAGTGSEVDWGSSFSKLETHEKITVMDPGMLPKLAVIDPELTCSLPKSFTAYTGWDALTHSMECLLNSREHEMASLYARQAVRYCGKYLERAVNGGDLEAREYMALASVLSGFAIAHKGITFQHSLECAISAIYPNVPHGAGMILLSKAYFQFFIEKGVCDEIFVELAQLLGLKNAKSPYDFLTAIGILQRRCDVDTLKMSDFGIERSCFREVIRLSRMSMGGDYLVDRYPLTDDDCLHILECSYR